jgi:hypothetical protein
MGIFVDPTVPGHPIFIKDNNIYITERFSLRDYGDCKLSQQILLEKNDGHLSNVMLVG